MDLSAENLERSYDLSQGQTTDARREALVAGCLLPLLLSNPPANGHIPKNTAEDWGQTSAQPQQVNYRATLYSFALHFKPCTSNKLAISK